MVHNRPSVYLYKSKKVLHEIETEMWTTNMRRASSAGCLCIILDDKLSSQEHSNGVNNTIKRNFYELNCIKWFPSPQMVNQIYFSTIYYQELNIVLKFIVR